MKYLAIFLMLFSVTFFAIGCGDAADTGETENGETENGETENGETENGETENGETENGETENGEGEAEPELPPAVDE